VGQSLVFLVPKRDVLSSGELIHRLVTKFHRGRESELVRNRWTNFMDDSILCLLTPPWQKSTTVLLQVYITLLLPQSNFW